MAQSYVYAGVGGYYGSNEGNLAGVFRRDAESSEWTHVLERARSLHRVRASARSKSRLRRHHGRRLSQHRSRRDVQARQFPRQRRADLVVPGRPGRSAGGCSPAARRFRSIAAMTAARAGSQADPRLPDPRQDAVRLPRHAVRAGIRRRPDEIYAVLEVGGRDALDRRRRDLERLQRSICSSCPSRSRGCAPSSSATPKPRACSTATPSAPAPPIPTASSSPCAWACSAAEIRARPGRICGSTASRRSPTAAT